MVHDFPYKCVGATLVVAQDEMGGHKARPYKIQMFNDTTSIPKIIAAGIGRRSV